MKLTNSDRILLTTILPQEGKYEDLICLNDIRKKCNPSQKEVEGWEVKTIGNQLTWKPLPEEYVIEFTELEKAIITTTLKKKNEESKLTDAILPLYKMFVL